MILGGRREQPSNKAMKSDKRFNSSFQFVSCQSGEILGVWAEAVSAVDG